MIPLDSTAGNGVEIVIPPSFSYKIKTDRERIESDINGREAIKQAIYKVLMTERYMYEIYSLNYGIELKDLIGKPKSYVKSELPVRIEDALKPDDRILAVYGFEFTDIDRETLAVKFYADTIFGETAVEWEMSV